jgi:hypothetical protein
MLTTGLPQATSMTGDNFIATDAMRSPMEDLSRAPTVEAHFERHNENYLPSELNTVLGGNELHC